MSGKMYMYFECYVMKLVLNVHLCMYVLLNLSFGSKGQHVYLVKLVVVS